jgi:hypothetical protein
MSDAPTREAFEALLDAARAAARLYEPGHESSLSARSEVLTAWDDLAKERDRLADDVRVEAVARSQAAEARALAAERALDAVGHAMGICYDHDHGCGGHGPVEEMVRAAKDGVSARGDAIDEAARAEASEGREKAIRAILDSANKWQPLGVYLEDLRSALASTPSAPSEDATAPGKCRTCPRGPGVAVTADGRCRYCVIAGVPAFPEEATAPGPVPAGRYPWTSQCGKCGRKARTTIDDAFAEVTPPPGWTVERGTWRCAACASPSPSAPPDPTTTTTTKEG